MKYQEQIKDILELSKEENKNNQKEKNMSYTIFRGKCIKSLNELSQKCSHNKKDINLTLISELKTVKTILK